MKLRSALAQERAVERLHEVRRAEYEDELLPVKAVHLREELIHHRVLDAGSGIGAASAEAMESSSSNTMMLGALWRALRNT